MTKYWLFKKITISIWIINAFFVGVYLIVQLRFSNALQKLYIFDRNVNVLSHKLLLLSSDVSLFNTPTTIENNLKDKYTDKPNQIFIISNHKRYEAKR